MSNVQIPNLPAGIALNGSELLEAVQAGTSVHISTSQIAAYASATFVTPSIGSVTANAPVTAATVSGAVTIGLSVNGVSNTYLAQMANQTLKANISGGSANPSDVTATAFLDSVFGSTTGNIIARGSSGWTSVGIGTNTQILASNGSGNLPFWQSFSSEMDNVLGYAQGSIAYRNATSWVTLPPGSSGQLLQTQGAGANPQWFTVTGAGTVTQINTGTGLTGGPITNSGTISIANTGVSAATYGSSYQVPVFVVNAQGQLTSVTNTTINAVTLTTGTITTTPTNNTDIANKAYVDAALNSVNYHAAANYATTADLGTVTYNNGSSGVGATITKTSPFATLSIDGANPIVGQRILVKNETNGAYNGVYTVTSVGSGSVGWVLTRATDFDQVGTGANEIAPGDYIFVISGSTNANTAWIQTTDFPITIGTTALVFTQVAGTGTYTAGTGLTLAGNQFSITNTTVSAGSYGSASTVPNYTVNAQGQLTSASSTSIAIDASAITSGTLSIARGGTNSTATPTAGGVGYGTGTAHAYTTAGTSGQVLTSNGAGAPTWSTAAATGVTSVSQTFTGGLISVSGSPITSTGTLALTVAGTSGGIPYFSSASTWASSAALTQYGIVYGGGAGATPASTAAGTTGQVLLANTSLAPTWGQVSLTTAVSGVLPSANGGTGVNNSATLTMSGNVTHAGAFTQTFTATGNTSVTLPTSGTLVNTSVTTLSSLVSVGTITTGTWSATTIATNYGGTGLTSFTSGGAVYATSTSALTTGTLPVTAGGTGAATLTANNVLLGNGTSALQVVAPGTNGNILTSNGTTWVSSTPAATGPTKAQTIAYAMVFGF